MEAAPFNRSAESLAHPARRWLEVLTRWGFIANAVVYLIVGILAVRWAMGAGGELTNPAGAFRELREQPFGKPLLIALIPGFFSYALWRVLAAVFDGDRDGNSWGGLFNRAFGVLKGILYAAVGMTAVRLGFGTSTGAADSVAKVLRGDAGPIIMFIVAGALFAVAPFEIYRACQAKLSQGLQLYGTGARARDWIVGVSRFGIGARGMVIGAFAVLLFRYAAAGRPKVPAAQQSFRVLGDIHPVLYLLAGAGIIAYGIYLIVLAHYRRVKTTA